MGDSSQEASIERECLWMWCDVDADDEVTLDFNLIYISSAPALKDGNGQSTPLATDLKGRHAGQS